MRSRWAIPGANNTPSSHPQKRGIGRNWIAITKGFLAEAFCGPPTVGRPLPCPKRRLFLKPSGDVVPPQSRLRRRRRCDDSGLEGTCMERCPP
jgi:hypothetical protein